MFERFTAKARAVVTAAVDEAQDAGVRYVGTEHLLMAMLAIGEGKAFSALTASGVGLEQVRAEARRLVGNQAPLGDDDAAALATIGIDLSAVVDQVERSFGVGALASDAPGRGRFPRRPFTKRAKKVLGLALREALRLHHDYIGTEHLLLGLIREGDGLAAKILVDGGVSLEALRDRVLAGIEDVEPAMRRSVFHRFRRPARDAIVRAREEAELAGANYIGTEHILAALVATGSGPAYTVLHDAGLTIDGVRANVAARTVDGSFIGWAGAGTSFRRRGMRLTPRAKHVLELALREAQRWGHGHIGTEHLLLALVREEYGMAAVILREAGLSLEDLRAKLISGLDQAA